MLVTSIQLEIREEETKEERISRVEKILDGLKGTDLIILPEIWNIGFLAFEDYYRESEPLWGATAERMSHKAKELNAYLLAGSLIEKEGDHYYNTSLFFDGNGKLIGRYRKIHLFGYGSAETKLLKPGRELVTVPTELGVFGLSTCYDLRFPELYRCLLDQGAEYFLVTSAWPYPRLEHWTVLNQARAIENSAYLFSSNCCGVQKGTRYLGHSMLVDPWGTPLASAGMHEALVTAKVNRGEVQKIRTEFPPVRDRVMQCKEQIWKEK